MAPKGPSMPPLPTAEQYQKAVLAKQRRDLGYTEDTDAYVTSLQNGTGSMIAPTGMAPQAPAPEEELDPFSQFMMSLAQSRGGGGGGGGGYNLGAEMQAIADAYNARLGEADRQRGAGETEITAARTAADEGIKKRQADNQAENATINKSVMDSYAQALARSQQESATLAAELQRQGIDPSKLAPGTTQASSYLTQARDAQSALQQRMGQVAGDSMAARNANMDLIALGARGNLANSYAQVKMQLDLERAQQEAAARAAAAAAAARGGGGGSVDPLTQMKKELEVQKLYNEVNGLGPVSQADFMKQNGKYALGALAPGTVEYTAAAAANQGGNADSVLNNLLTSRMDNGDGSFSNQLNKSAYASSYAALQRASQAQRDVAQAGWSPLIAQQRGYSRAKNAISKLNFRSR